jgi:hypothetical protein
MKRTLSQAPFVSQNALLGICDKVLKSSMRQSLLSSHLLPSATQKEKGQVWG